MFYTYCHSSYWRLVFTSGGIRINTSLSMQGQQRHKRRHRHKKSEHTLPSHVYLFRNPGINIITRRTNMFSVGTRKFVPCIVNVVSTKHDGAAVTDVFDNSWWPILKNAAKLESPRGHHKTIKQTYHWRLAWRVAAWFLLPLWIPDCREFKIIAERINLG